MQEIITLILCRGDPVKSQTQPNWARAPWIEQYYCADVLKASQGPRLLTTHLPYKLLASALQGSKAKVPQASRNIQFYLQLCWPGKPVSQSCLIMTQIVICNHCKAECKTRCGSTSYCCLNYS